MIPGAWRSVCVSASNMPLELGTMVGPYEIIAPIGAGGMGEVYRALDRRLGRSVALKVLPASVVSDETRLRRFEVEAKAVAELSHPNILAIFDFGREGDIVYAALEFVEGSTLKSVLAAGSLSPRKAADYARQIVLALAAAHARGVLHRDIKPDNVMITDDGRVKLLDFGLARRVEASQGDTTSIAGLTDPGKVLGTFGYMSPEQVRGGTVDERSDLFAVGVVLYEMLAGEPPFGRSDRADALAAVLRDDPPSLPPAVPTSLQRIVQRCLEKAPAQRYQSAADLAFSLEAFGGSGVSGAATPVPETPQPIRRRQLGAAILTSVIAVAAAAGWAVDHWLTRPTPAPTFSRVTYRRGLVFRGRFAPGGTSIVYDASWEGRPMDVFDSALGSQDSRPRGLAPSVLLAIASSGDLLILQSPRVLNHYIRVGKLATATPSGSQRLLADGVSSADWTPGSRELVVSKQDGAEWVVEWPLGHVVYRSASSISDVRVSPAGDRVAWLERKTIEESAIVLADRQGRASVLASAGTGPGGLAWTPNSREVWFTASKSVALADIEVRASTLDGRSRVILDLPGGVRILDIAPDGRVLVSRPRESGELVIEDSGVPRTNGWLSSSAIKDLSDDGSQVLFTEDGLVGFDLFLRPTTGGPAINLRAGLVWARARLSPDGLRVASRQTDHILVIPVKSGNEVSVPASGQVAAWLADSRRLLLWSPEDRGGRPAIVAIDASTPEVVQEIPCERLPILVDSGNAIACVSDGAITVRAISGGATRRITPTRPLGSLIGASADGRSIFSLAPDALPASVLAIDMASGRVSVAREPKVPDATGVWRVGPMLLTPDRRVLAYSLGRQLDELYLYTGLR